MQKYKFNIQDGDLNEVLEDLRNYYNFRGTVPNFLTIAAQNPRLQWGLGGNKAVTRYWSIKIVLYVTK